MLAPTPAETTAARSSSAACESASSVPGPSTILRDPSSRNSPDLMVVSLGSGIKLSPRFCPSAGAMDPARPQARTSPVRDR